MGRQCAVCGLDKEDKDFLCEEMCYKCQYKAKVGFKKIKDAKECVFCGAKLSNKRWTYCSEECSRQTKSLTDKSRWYRNVKGPNVVWY